MPTKPHLITISGERRIARIVVTDENLIRMMFTNFEAKIKTIQGLPEEAVFLTAVNDPAKSECWFFFYHPSFESVPLGKEIPEIPWRVSNAY